MTPRKESFGLLAVKFAKDRLRVAALGGFAGFAAGIVYWVVALPSSSAFLAVANGFVGGIIYAWVGWTESKG